uniref:MAGE domain-containing protein n=1 Tax=Graphocephala atropunctata TaxID=36148 RepID=A0A1B6KP30_9HEMI
MQSSQRKRAERSQRGEESQSQRGEGSQSQRTRSDNFSEEQLEAAVLNVTAFLLSDLRNKRRLKKDEVVTNALNKSARQYGAIMKRVKSNLSDVFGLQITKIPDCNDDAFIIINKHREEFSKLTKMLTSESELQDRLVLTVSLASIFMNRGEMFESHLMTILETIGFFSDKFYGSSCERKMKDYVTKLVNKQFVKQMYLDAKVVARPNQEMNPPLPVNESKVTVLRWGYRAYLEVDADKIVQYLEKIHDNKRPPAFPASYYKELKIQQATMRAQAQG